MNNNKKNSVCQLYVDAKKKNLAVWVEIVACNVLYEQDQSCCCCCYFCGRPTHVMCKQCTVVCVCLSRL